MVKNHFFDNIVISASTLFDLLRKDIDDDFIKMGLKIMVTQKMRFVNKYRHWGYLQFVSGNYLFHPEDIKEDRLLPLNIRGPGIRYMPDTVRNVEEELLEMISEVRGRDVGDEYARSKKALRGAGKDFGKVRNIIVGTSQRTNARIIEYAIKEYKKRFDAGREDLPSHIYNILRHFRYYLIDKDLIENNRLMYNANFDSYLDGPGSSGRGSVNDLYNKVDINKNFIGHIVGNVPKIIDDDYIFKKETFTFCLDTFKNIPENDYIVGFITKERGSLYLKLRRTEKLGKISDKRKIRKGFKGIQINNKKEVQEIYLHVAENPITDEELKRTKITNFCTLIEHELRRKQYNNPDIRWFYDYYL